MKHLKYIGAVLMMLLVVNFYTPFAYAAAFAGVDNFDSYSNGDLNGNSGGSGWSTAWAGDTTFDVQGSVTYNSSAKAMGVVSNTSAEDDILRTFPGTDSGDFYFALRTNTTTVTSDYCSIEIWNGATFGGVLAQLNLGTTELRTYDGSFHALTTFSADTWYIINVNFVSTTQFKVRWKVGGGSFSSFTSDMTYTSSVSSPDKINLAVLRNSASDCYMDEFGTSDPDGGGGGGASPTSSGDDIIAFI